MTTAISAVSANFTRPSDTTVYASGDLLADSTTAGSVHPLQFTMPAANVKINRIRLTKSGAATSNASFRIHLYGEGPTVANGDNAAWSTTESTYYGSVDLDASSKAFTDKGVGLAFINTGGDSQFIAAPTALIVYGLLETRAAYTPTSAEVFTAYLTCETY